MNAGLRKKKMPVWAAVCLGMAGAACLLRVLARALPGFADSFSALVNPVAVNTIGRLSSVFPFSLFEILLCVLAFFVLQAACTALKLLLFCLPSGTKEEREEKRSGAKGTALRQKTAGQLKRLLVIICGMFLVFEVNEDVYFSRTGFAARYGLERRSYSNEELARVCAYLIGEINQSAPSVERNEKGIMQVPEDTEKRVRLAMRDLGESYPELSGWYPPPKPVFFSRILSRLDITGIYSMFTVEANYNRDIPPYNIPFTMGHELSHLKGFESEKEANFLGYLCCIRSEDPALHYSGAMLGWVYCGNELHKRDRGLWKKLYGEICPEAEEDLRDNNRYWDRFKGRAAETMHEINDSYLKTEGLPEGYASYDLVTDMIVAHTLSEMPDGG